MNNGVGSNQMTAHICLLYLYRKFPYQFESNKKKKNKRQKKATQQINIATHGPENSRSCHER